MPQMIYSVAAILLLGVSFFNLNHKVHGTEARLMFSELALDMTGVGAEVLDEIGKHKFDPGTISDLLVATDSLSLSSDFGAASCNPDANYSGCFTVSDFHGKTASRTRTRPFDGTAHAVPYNVTSIAVQYVDETPPHAPSTERTFAKEVTLAISTPALVDGNGVPFEIEMSRIYMYPDL